MPRPDKMRGENRVFYWPDTGPVEYVAEHGFIVSANGVDDGTNLYSWKAGEGSFHTDDEGREYTDGRT